MTLYESAKGKEKIFIVESYKDIDEKENAIYIITNKHHLSIDKDYLGYAQNPGREPISLNIRVTKDIGCSKSPILLVPANDELTKFHIIHGGDSEVLSLDVPFINGDKCNFTVKYKCSNCKNTVSRSELYSKGSPVCPYCGFGFKHITKED